MNQLQHRPTAFRHLCFLLGGILLSAFASGCTIYHSKQADFATVQGELRPEAKFVTEEDSGLSILGMLAITEPDHFSILMDRAQRRYNCDQIRFAQLDFYTDHWGIVAFPISRMTLICDPPAKSEDQKKSSQK